MLRQDVSGRATSKEGLRASMLGQHFSFLLTSPSTYVIYLPPSPRWMLTPVSQQVFQKKALLVRFANSHGANIPTMADFNPPT